MNAPQIVMLVLLVVAGTITALKHGDAHPSYNFFRWAVAAGVHVGILYWGGFWA